MTAPNSLAVLAGAALAGPIGQSFSDAQIRNAYYDTIVVDWNTSIAAGGNAQASQPNATGGIFVVTRSSFCAFIVSASGGSVAYTGFSQDPSVTKANNTFASYESLTATLKFNSRQIGSSTPTRVPLLFGTPNNPMFYPYTQPVIEEGEKVYVNLTNQSGEIIQAQLLLEGFVVK